jgi:hypothetical protein
MMEAASTSETVNFYQTTWRCNPEDSYLHTHSRENLKFYLCTFILVISQYKVQKTICVTLHCKCRNYANFLFWKLRFSPSALNFGFAVSNMAMDIFSSRYFCSSLHFLFLWSFITTSEVWPTSPLSQPWSSVETSFWSSSTCLGLNWECLIEWLASGCHVAIF